MSILIASRLLDPTKIVTSNIIYNTIPRHVVYEFNSMTSAKPIKIIKYHVLTDELHLQSLLEKKSLPLSAYRLQKEVDYFFYWNSYLYGLYRLFRIGRVNQYLLKNYFKPIYYYSANKDIEAITQELADTHKILNFFKRSNPRRKKLYLSITESASGDKMQLRWCSENMPTLFAEHNFSLRDDEVLNQALTKLTDFYNQKKFIDTKSTVYFLKELGWLINQKLCGGDEHHAWQLAIDAATEMCCYNRSAIPLAYAFDGKNFLFERLTIYYHPEVWQTRLSGEQVHQLFSMALITGDMQEDEAMIQELERIQHLMGGIHKKQRKRKARPFNIHTQSSLSNPYELAEIFSKYDWVHYIGHGEVIQDDFHFVLAGGKKIGAHQLMKNGIRFPKVLVLSACHSVHPSLRKAFFAGGGYCLLGAVGYVPSDALAILFASFYWQMFYKKYTVLQAFSSIQRKAFINHWLASFYLQVHGNPQVRLLN